MIIPRIFDVVDGTIVPSAHCYTLKSFKAIIDAYPDDFLPRLLYVYYKTCPDPENNPFFNIEDSDKDESILHEVSATFSVDDPLILDAITFCNKVYNTPTRRAYMGIRAMMDKLATFFENQSLTTGRDGSLTAMVAAATKYSDLRESFKGIEKDYKEEIKELARGDSFTAYDM